jgi:hypothetical protein
MVGPGAFSWEAATFGGLVADFWEYEVWGRASKAFEKIVGQA